MKKTKEYKKAKKRVEARQGFYYHLLSFVAVNFWIAVMNDFVIVYPMAFWWGFGLLMHYVGVFGLPGSGVLSKDWEEREIEKEMARMSNQKKSLPASNREAIELPEMQKRWSEEDLV